MTTASVEVQPWRELPGSLAPLIEAQLPAMTDEILAAIAREVPEYARPLEGSFGRGIRRGVGAALEQFVALVRDPDADRGASREVYRELGRGELRQGRTLDSLQAAYRVGARVAWRHLAAAASAAGTGQATLATLAEAIFAYIDRLAADSVEGYAEAIAEREGERARRRGALLALLVREPPAERADLERAAVAAGWRPPRTAAALACEAPDLEAVRRRLAPETLAGEVAGAGCAVVCDPDGPRTRRDLQRAGQRGFAALGPAVAPAGLGRSWRLARAALEARRQGRLERASPLYAVEHLGELLVFASDELCAEIESRRLAALDGLAAGARSRMEQTALAYVQHGGNAAAVARALHLHPQSVRHRLRRLRALLGDQLDDPAARFELEAALRRRAAA